MDGAVHSLFCFYAGQDVVRSVSRTYSRSRDDQCVASGRAQPTLTARAFARLLNAARLCLSARLVARIYEEHAGATGGMTFRGFLAALHDVALSAHHAEARPLEALLWQNILPLAASCGLSDDGLADIKHAYCLLDRFRSSVDRCYDHFRAAAAPAVTGRRGDAAGGATRAQRGSWPEAGPKTRDTTIQRRPSRAGLAFGGFLSWTRSFGFFPDQLSHADVVDIFETALAQCRLRRAVESKAEYGLSRSVGCDLEMDLLEQPRGRGDLTVEHATPLARNALEAASAAEAASAGTPGWAWRPTLYDPMRWSLTRHEFVVAIAVTALAVGTCRARRRNALRLSPYMS